MAKMNVFIKKKKEKVVAKKKVDTILNTTKIIYETLSYPLDKVYITSNFGYRFHPIDKVYKNHRGMDLRANYEYAYAISTGYVSEVGYDKGLGIYCRLKIGTFEFTYGHLSEIYVKPNDIVSAGKIIGLTGSTGSSTAPHLHFGVVHNNAYLNPLEFLKHIEDYKDLLSIENKTSSDQSSR